MPRVWLTLLVLSIAGLADEPSFPGLATGDLVGVSSRRELTGFVAQAATRSPIDHAGIVTQEPDGIYVHHWTRMGMYKQPLNEFLKMYRDHMGTVFAVQGRLTTSLSPWQEIQLRDFLRAPPLEIVSNANCAEFVRAAFQTAGINVGRVVPVTELNTAILGEPVARHAVRFFNGKSTVVTSRSLFEVGFRVVAGNISLEWDFLHMLENWRSSADLSALARAYFGRSASKEADLSHNLLSELVQRRCTNLVRELEN